jgi:hypothetical protein
MNNVLSWTQGTLSGNACELLAKFATEIPSNGVILDLNCGSGRSTVVMALALQTVKRGDAAILAVDSHITNPLSENPYKEGSIMMLLESLRHFKVANRVIPIVSPLHQADKLIDKRSANLIVVQSPVTILSSFNEDAVVGGIQLAKYAIRRGGIILVCCPNPIYRAQLDRILAHQFYLDGAETVCDTSEIVGFRYE